MVIDILLVDIKCDNIHQIFCPQYDQLTIDKITTWINEKPACHNYYPIWKEVAKLPKQWIVNVAYSVLGAPFRQWIR